MIMITFKIMTIKDFEDNQINLVETPNKKKIADKPLKARRNSETFKELILMFLKARAKAIQDKERCTKAPLL